MAAIGAATHRDMDGSICVAKGYWMAHIDVTDPEGFKEYVPLRAHGEAPNLGARRTFGHRQSQLDPVRKGRLSCPLASKRCDGNPLIVSQFDGLDSFAAAAYCYERK